jgi:hypothetical protein
MDHGPDASCTVPVWLGHLGLLLALRHLTPGLPLYLDSKASAFAVNDTLCRGSESEASGALG